MRYGVGSWVLACGDGDLAECYDFGVVDCRGGGAGGFWVRGGGGVGGSLRGWGVGCAFGAGEGYGDGLGTGPAALGADFSGDFEAWGRVRGVRGVGAGGGVGSGCGGCGVGHGVSGRNGCVTCLANVHVCGRIGGGESCLGRLRVGIVTATVDRLAGDIGVDGCHKREGWKIWVV